MLEHLVQTVIHPDVIDSLLTKGIPMSQLRFRARAYECASINRFSEFWKLSFRAFEFLKSVKNSKNSTTVEMN